MKLSFLTAFTLAAAVSLPSIARADEAEPVRARFNTTASRQVVETAACSFDAVSTFDGADHAFDVRVDGWRCVSTPMPQSAIPLLVRMEASEDAQRVVVEVRVPEGVEVEHLRTAVVSVTQEIQRRVARAPVTVVTKQPIQDVARVPATRSWIHDETQLEDDWSKPRKRASPGLMAGGIVLLTLGSIVAIGGLFGTLGTSSYSSNAGGVFALTSGLAGVVCGIPMIAVGGKKVPRVAAGVSPTGGSVRITF